MREILLTTESCSDVPKELQEKYGIIVLPMHVSIGPDTFDDGSVPLEELFDYYEKTGDTPKSSADNVQDYIDFFTRLRQEHPDCVIYNFALSSGISTNYEHSVLAVQEFEDVYTIDTKAFGAGCIAYLIEARTLIDSKGGQENITDYQGLFEEFQAIQPHIQSSFVPDSLEFLRAGGRVTNAAYIASSILKIKPEIIRDEQGRLYAAKKYRGPMIKVCEKYIRETEAAYNIKKDYLNIMYVYGAEEAVLKKMEETAYDLGFKKVNFDICGAVISCHGGYKAIGLGFVTL